MVLAAAGWMVAVGVVYFLPAGWEGISDPHLQTPSPSAVRIAALASAVLNLLAALSIFLAAWGYGNALLALPALSARLPALRENRLHRTLSEVGLGLGLLSLTALGLSLPGLLRPVALVLVMAVGAALALFAIVREPPPGGWRRLPPKPVLSRLEWVVLVVIVSAAGFALAGALAPEVEYDAVWYHLDFAERHLDAGRIVDDVCLYVSPYPWGTELLFSYGLALKGGIAAKLVHFGFGALSALAVYALGARTAGRRAALLATAAFVVTPTVLWEATTAYIELATAFFVLLALMWVLQYVEQRSLPVLVLAGTFLGFALSTKHLAVIAAVPLAAIVLWASGGGGRLRRLAPVALLTAVAVLPALPWYVRAQVQAGNPVFPVLYDVFGADARRWDAASDAGLARFQDRFGQGHGLFALLKLPWSTTMHGAAFGGSIGLAYLMFVPLAVHRRIPKPVLLIGLFCLGYLLLWASPISSLQLRFLVPVLGPLAVVAGYGLDRVLRAAHGWHRAAGAAVALISVTVLVLSLPPFLRAHERDREGDDGWLTHVVREVPLNVVTGAEPERSYLARRIPAYEATLRLNALAAPGDSAVVATDPYPDFYAEPALVPDYAVCLRHAGLGSGGEADHRALRDSGVDYVLVEERLREDSVVRWFDETFASRYLELVYDDEKARVFRVRAEPTP